MPAPLAMSGSSTDAARIKREQAAKRARDEKPCVLRRLRPTPPISEDGFRESHASDKYSCFMDQCDKQKSAIGDHDVFEYPMGNRAPQELTPYVFNWKYEDATLKSHYIQAAAVVKDWLRETHKSYPQTLTNLLSKVSARPMGSCHDKDDPDSEIKVVLSLISKYQFQYRRPSKRNYEAALDEWHYKSEFH